MPANDILRNFDQLLVREDNRGLAVECEKSLPLFCTSLTPWPMTPFHQAWWEFLENTPRGLLLAPRDHAKTQHFTINRAAWETIRDRDQRVLLVSGTMAMVNRMMRDVKSLLTSEKVREIWGDLKGEKWDAAEIILPGRSYPQKEANITALSVGGPVTSGHYDLVILDDVCDFENTRSQEQRDKLWDWLRFTLLPVVAPKGRLHLSGTRYHFDDLYGRLLDPKQNPRGISALIGKAIQDDETALWPERYSLTHLKNLRADLGTVIFNSQYQNDAEAMKGSFFKAEWIKRYQTPPANLRKFQFYDLAISEKSTADYFAGVTVGTDGASLHVLGAFHDRLSFGDQLKRIQATHDFYHRSTSPVLRIGIESNQYQAALAKELKKVSMLPVKQVHSHKDKITRAGRLQALMENGKVSFPMQGTEELELELLTFPEGRHDDLVDALAGAAELAGVGMKRPATVGRVPYGF